MKELTVLRVIVLTGAIASTFFGFLFVFNPGAVHTLSQRASRPMLAVDAALNKNPRITGGILLLVGIPLYLLLFVF